MKLKFFSLALLAFLFVACGDDSSSAVEFSTEKNSDSFDKNISIDEFSCVVKRGDNRVRQTIVVPGEFYGYSEMVVQGKKARAIVKNYYIDRTEAEMVYVCEEMEDQSDGYDRGSFMCNKDSSKFTVTIPKAFANSLSEVAEEMTEECVDYENDWNAKQPKLSSSSKVESSSEELNMSSDSKNDDLDSCEVVDVSMLEDYDVAYEFSDTSFLGKDFVGGYDALVGEGLPYGDCSSLILDGSSGLFVPFADVFGADNFAMETKIYPTKYNEMQNIFTAEPPGSRGSGWILRLENGKLHFLIRDNNMSWKETELQEVALESWTTLRVEKMGTELNSEIRIFMNGKIIHRDDSYYQMSNMSYNLGIGYDAVNQDLHNRYFVGKIDYIRFKNYDQN